MRPRARHAPVAAVALRTLRLVLTLVPITLSGLPAFWKIAWLEASDSTAPDHKATDEIEPLSLRYSTLNPQAAGITRRIRRRVAIVC